ncbi:hypothetical protein HDA40_001814 [Hamadaea flava]|uniref:Uncharacterized protein n=1 Tax=Hamadaea flava TaxID=1742688 RepID=A0ABV8LP39_9ACTN|nr:hypothetical protein [Hamadaea flava]MCP2323307.1 hypothetical protein [Hamadaea flava]
MTAEQITATPADPDAWLRDEEGARRMIMIMATDRWDDLASH